MKVRHVLIPALLALLLACLPLLPANAQEPDLSAQAPLGNSFTFQGRLLDDGVPVDGAYDLQFKLFNVASGGAALGTQDKAD